MPEEKLPPVTPNLPPSLREKPRNPVYRDDASESLLPTLLSFLQTTWDDHGRISWEGASISIRLRAGTCFVSLTCPTSENQAQMEISSLADVMLEVETQLVAGRLVWEDTYKKVKKMKQALADAAKKK